MSGFSLTRIGLQAGSGTTPPPVKPQPRPQQNPPAPPDDDGLFRDDEKKDDEYKTDGPGSDGGYNTRSGPHLRLLCGRTTQQDTVDIKFPQKK
jgi:hypothetical protein